MKHNLCVAALLWLILAALHAAEPRVAILGDSITYSGRWPTMVESALRSTPSFAEAEIVNFGLASETVSGLSEQGHAGGKFPRPNLHERLGRILDGFKPTHVLACYGMNDGIYLPLDEARQKAFQDGITKLKTEVENRGAKLVVITAPLYDGDHPAPTAQGYDAVLDAQAAWLSSQKGWQVIDIRPDLRSAVAGAKQTDPKFVYAGDKVHPGQQGHDFIAASVIRQLWPFWQLQGKPVSADAKALSILGNRHVILQRAWLKKTQHKRPGVPDGLPLEEAESQAAKLLKNYLAASLTASVPWDLPALCKAPEFVWGDGKEVRSLYFTSEPYEGKPTRVFAYYATPGTLAGDTSKDKNLPGIVLVHGGGGKAFDGWARLWASRGYAAIAMDLSGNALGKPLPDGGPQQKDEIKFRTDAPPTDQWTYHAVAAVIRSHSLLRSFPEVDAKRTAVTGISWGGYLTCIVAGLDDRFKAAVPVYGCGYLHVNSTWLNRFTGMPEEARAKWIQLWDPSNYVGSARMPMLFVNGGKDFAYPPDSHAMTYALVKSPKNLHFVPDLPHGHIFDRPSAIEIFIRQCLEGGTPLARIADPEIHAKRVTAKVETHTKLVKAELHYTLDPLPGDAKTRVWISKPANIVEGTIQADLPAEKPTVWFLTVEDDRQAKVSSRLLIASEQGR